MELEFPIEFFVEGTPVSSQTGNAKSKNQWKQNIREAFLNTIEQPKFLSDSRLSVTMIYLPLADAEGDLDNLVKPVLDAMCKSVYFDDKQIDRILAHRIRPDSTVEIISPSAKLVEALTAERPLLYIKLNNTPDQEF